MLERNCNAVVFQFLIFYIRLYLNILDPAPWADLKKQSRRKHEHQDDKERGGKRGGRRWIESSE